MPKFAQVRGKDLIKILKKYGFEEHSWVGSHCTLRHHTTSKRTTVPAHNKPLGKGLLSAILRQVDLPKSILEK